MDHQQYILLAQTHDILTHGYGYTIKVMYHVKLS
jgi:hypothetical protein